MISIESPKTKNDYRLYYKFRWEKLRRPLGQPLGTEKDDLELVSEHIMLINEKHKVVGVGRVHFNSIISNKKAQIRYMAIDEKIRKKGYGTKILRELEKIAFNNNVCDIFLHSREEAVEFYMKNNYEKIKRSHLLFGEIQHWLMEKKL